MMETLEQHIADLRNADFRVRTQALAAIVAAGRRAAPVLVAALPTADPASKVALARGLSEIAEPATADTFAALLDDGDEVVRACGAVGLARIGDPRACAALIATIDDFPDLLRDPYTPSADTLIELGPPTLALVVPLLDAPSAMTRARAFTVIHDIVAALPEGADWSSLWRDLGRYTADAPVEHRRAAARSWGDWIARHFPGT